MKKLKIAISGPTDRPEHTRHQGLVYDHFKSIGYDPILAGTIRKCAVLDADELYLTEGWSTHPRSIGLAFLFLAEGKVVRDDSGVYESAEDLMEVIA